MANLLANDIGLNYKGLLNLDTTINTGLDGTLRVVTDGEGDSSPLYLSTTGIGFGTTSVWDNTNGRLGIGTTSPQDKLQVTTSGTGTMLFNGAVIQQIDSYFYLRNNNGQFYFQNNAGATTYMSLIAGKLGINVTATAQLQIKGSGSTSATTSLLVQNSASTNLMSVLDNGNVGIGTVTPVSKLNIGVSPTASANYGTISLGGGAFDGSTSGFFTGSASGTSLAINEASGYAGNLLDMQVAGSSKFKVSNTGALTIGITTYYNTTITLSGGSGQQLKFYGNDGGNILGSFYDISGTYARLGIGKLSPNAGIDLLAENLTGSTAISALSITQTWNTSGTPTAILTNITDTASNASSLLMDLQKGGTSQFKVAKNGNLTLGKTSNTSYTLTIPSNGGNFILDITGNVCTFGQSNQDIQMEGIYLTRANDNMTLGGTSASFGTSATNTFSIKNGTAPTTSIADHIQIFSKDSSAGSANATLAFRTEQEVEAGVGIVSTDKIRAWFNGVEYYIPLTAV